MQHAADVVVAAIDSGNSINYATGATYAPQGALASVLHGYVSGGFAGITESWGYSDPDQEPTSILATSSAGTALSLTYGYSQPGGNNGSVASITDAKDNGRDETMTYDPLDRILAAQTAASSGQDCWGSSFGASGAADDALGNLLDAAPNKSGCTGMNLSLSVNGNNQINGATGIGYDAPGNMTGDGNYTYTYDDEGRICSVGGSSCSTGTTYTYDGDGLRVEKSSGTLYWRAYTGQVIEETDTSGDMQHQD